jgi:cyclic beta-1,2-glucan synthetase
MDAVVRRLVQEPEGLVLLLAPPFAESADDPGYIRGYPPGVRENGGQYTHAAIWALWALIEVGEVERAVDLFGRLLPIRRALTAEAAACYRAEPYALAADVYSASPWSGRGGWTWYTGAAGWAYRLGLEQILGLRPSEGGWHLDPHIPAAWPGFEIVWRHGATVVRIRVDNPRGVTSGVERTVLDGARLERPILPRFTDGRVHEVLVTMG